MLSPSDVIITVNSPAPYADGFPEVEEETKWSLILPEEVIRRIHEMVINRVDELFYEVTRAGIFSCPSLGEYDENYAWVEVMTPGSPINSVVVSIPDRTLDLFVNNYPEDPFDRHDPDHPEWKTASPTQWVVVAGFLRPILRGEVTKW